jgi:hypothetical protein
MYPAYYKKELVILTLGSTFLTYLLVVFNVYDFVSPIIINLLIIWILLFIITKKKKLHMLITSSVGIVIVTLIQTVLVLLFLHYGVLTENDLMSSFSTKAYFTQSINAALITTISLYIIWSKSGFSFTLDKGGHTKFLTATVSLILIISGVLYICMHHDNNVHLILIFVFVLIVSTLILLYLSFRRDNYEYR